MPLLYGGAGLCETRYGLWVPTVIQQYTAGSDVSQRGVVTKV